jgi:hypothetical protein
MRESSGNLILSEYLRRLRHHLLREYRSTRMNYATGALLITHNLYFNLIARPVVVIPFPRFPEWENVSPLNLKKMFRFFCPVYTLRPLNTKGSGLLPSRGLTPAQTMQRGEDSNANLGCLAITSHRAPTCRIASWFRRRGLGIRNHPAQDTMACH